MWSCHWTLGSDPAAQLRAGAVLPMHLLRPIPCSSSDLCPPPFPWPQPQICPAHSSWGGWSQNSRWCPRHNQVLSAGRPQLRCCAWHSTRCGGHKADSPCPPGIGVLKGVGQRQVRTQMKGDTVQLPGPRLGSEKAAGTKTLPC